MVLLEMFYFSPQLPLVVGSLVNLTINNLDSGSYRWGNVYGNTAIFFAAGFSNSLMYGVGNEREASKLGFLSGLLVSTLPYMRVVNWQRFMPNHVSAVIGAGYMTYFGGIYYMDACAVEDAGED